MRNEYDPDEQVDTFIKHATIEKKIANMGDITYKNYLAHFKTLLEELKLLKIKNIFAIKL